MPGTRAFPFLSRTIMFLQVVQIKYYYRFIFKQRIFCVQVLVFNQKTNETRPTTQPLNLTIALLPEFPFWHPLPSYHGNAKHDHHGCFDNGAVASFFASLLRAVGVTS